MLLGRSGNNFLTAVRESRLQATWKKSPRKFTRLFQQRARGPAFQQGRGVERVREIKYPSFDKQVPPLLPCCLFSYPDFSTFHRVSCRFCLANSSKFYDARCTYGWISNNAIGKYISRFEIQWVSGVFVPLQFYTLNDCYFLTMQVTVFLWRGMYTGIYKLSNSSKVYCKRTVNMVKM